MDSYGFGLQPWRRDFDGLYHPLVFDFEMSFTNQTFANGVGHVMNRWWWTSIVLAFVYVALIFGGQAWMKGRERFELRRPLILWNVFLALFSIYGMIRCVPEMLYNLNKEGLQHTICNNDNIYGLTGFWITIFCWSKAPELIDTLFIVLRKQKLIFLHWFHHATVMVYAWYSYHNWTASGRWFVFMNYTVHAMMYSYYACRAMKFRIPKWVQISITVCQLLQMVVGCFVNYKAYSYKQLGDTCHVTYSNIGWSFAMYAVYFGLFLHFFCLAYFPKKKATASASAPAARQASPTKPVTDCPTFPIDNTARRLIPFGILMILVLQNIVYPMSSIAKYVSWCVYGLALVLSFLLRSLSGAKTTFGLPMSDMKKSE